MPLPLFISPATNKQAGILRGLLPSPGKRLAAQGGMTAGPISDPDPVLRNVGNNKELANTSGY